MYGGLGVGGHRDDSACRFGVGKAQIIDKVEVRWPDRANTLRTFGRVEPSRFNTLRQGGSREAVKDEERR